MAECVTRVVMKSVSLKEVKRSLKVCTSVGHRQLSTTLHTHALLHMGCLPETQQPSIEPLLGSLAPSLAHTKHHSNLRTKS